MRTMVKLTCSTCTSYYCKKHSLFVLINLSSSLSLMCVRVCECTKPKLKYTCYYDNGEIADIVFGKDATIAMDATTNVKISHSKVVFM